MNQIINYLSRKRKNRRKIWKHPKLFIGYSQTIDDVDENLEQYNPIKKRKVLTVFDYGIADMEAYKKLSPIVTELSIGGRKLTISLNFITQSHFKVPKD